MPLLLSNLSWVPYVFNETVTFGFVVHKAYKYLDFPIHRHGQGSAPDLLVAVIRHNILYYLT